MAGDAQGLPFNDSERRQLDKLADGGGTSARLARDWLAGGRGKIEQENFAPRAPTGARRD